MSHGGAYEDEMSSLRRIDEEKIDRLLTGDSPAGEPSLDELAAVVRDVGAAYSEPPTEPVRARHLTAMRAARLAAGRWKPAGESVNGAPLNGSPPVQRTSPVGRGGSGQPKLLARVLRRPAAGRQPRLAAGAAALVALLTLAGLTGLGALPDRVQAALADAARAVGVEVPDPQRQDPKAPRKTTPAPSGGTPAPASSAAPASPGYAPGRGPGNGTTRTDFARTPCAGAAAARDECAAERAEQPEAKTPARSPEKPVPPAAEQPTLTVPVPPAPGDGAGSPDPVPDGREQPQPGGSAP